MGGWGTDSLLLLLLLPYNDDLDDGDVDGGGDDVDCDGAMSYPIYIFQSMQLKIMLLLPPVGQYYISFATKIHLEDSHNATLILTSCNVMDLKQGGDARLSHNCILKRVDPKHSNLLILTFERQSNASIIVNINLTPKEYGI